MKRWTPQSLYGAKPWALIAAGAFLCFGATIRSLSEGSWSVWRGFACFGGAGLAIAGGAILQMRQQYRARSKLRREAPR